MTKCAAREALEGMDSIRKRLNTIPVGEEGYPRPSEIARGIAAEEAALATPCPKEAEVKALRRVVEAYRKTEEIKEMEPGLHIEEKETLDVWHRWHAKVRESRTEIAAAVQAAKDKGVL
jgi:hypothetical protein